MQTHDLEEPSQKEKMQNKTNKAGSVRLIIADNYLLLPAK
jgi:hypothetical protein